MRKACSPASTLIQPCSSASSLNQHALLLQAEFSMKQESVQAELVLIRLEAGEHAFRIRMGHLNFLALLQLFFKFLNPCIVFSLTSSRESQADFCGWSSDSVQELFDCSPSRTLCSSFGKSRTSSLNCLLRSFRACFTRTLFVICLSAQLHFRLLVLFVGCLVGADRSRSSSSLFFS
jgi:hypothetical protein